MGGGEVIIWPDLGNKVIIWLDLRVKVIIWLDVRVKVIIWLNVRVKVIIWLNVRVKVIIWLDVRVKVIIWLDVRVNVIIWLDVRVKARSIIRYCPTTVGHNIQLLWEKTDLDYAVGQCLLSDGNSAHHILSRRNTMSDGDIKLCLENVPDSGLGSLANVRQEHGQLQSTMTPQRQLFLF